ncbi:hypothetical protein PUNSTDRAFT_50584 [Punctularia strigosozonata HHB-11173 SS5]|uniref:uncharacterized protein n=1 Tax=Punctularia strigosozonata (strain HHB-11173) TaxID=741275 RepID=UPI00044179CB|nr:uncharacterized protein PUNSTDRAFT_50584 [Punctularia strigosozonata HHB-11173 SS5]EIN11687.1 hypothetical protein PUNSTDRAFT_50584 [Punctularia strigosozonata HHB-11173 SS5]
MRAAGSDSDDDDDDDAHYALLASTSSARQSDVRSLQRGQGSRAAASVQGNGGSSGAHSARTSGSSSPRTGVTFDVPDPSQVGDAPRVPAMTAPGTRGTVSNRAPRGPSSMGSRSLSSPATGVSYEITESLRAVQISTAHTRISESTSRPPSAEPPRMARAESAPAAYPDDVQGPIDVTAPRPLRPTDWSSVTGEAARVLWSRGFGNRPQLPVVPEASHSSGGSVPMSSSSPPTEVTQRGPAQFASSSGSLQPRALEAFSTYSDISLAAPPPTPSRVPRNTGRMQDTDERGFDEPPSLHAVEDSPRDERACPISRQTRNIAIQAERLSSSSRSSSPYDPERRQTIREGKRRARDLPSPSSALRENMATVPNSPAVSLRREYAGNRNTASVPVSFPRPEDQRIKVPLSVYCICHPRPEYAPSDEPIMELKINQFCKCRCAAGCGHLIPPWEIHECLEREDSRQAPRNTLGLDINRFPRDPGSISSGPGRYGFQQSSSSFVVYPSRADPRSPARTSQIIPMSMEAAFPRPSPPPSLLSLPALDAGSRASMAMH